MWRRVWSFVRLPSKSANDVAGFVVAFVLTTRSLALDMAIFQPWYLRSFERCYIRTNVVSYSANRPQ
jgi:hypothetical protein